MARKESSTGTLYFPSATTELKDPSLPSIIETRRAVASIRYRTDLLDLQRFDSMGRFFVQ
jgi:hypothetical protein